MGACCAAGENSDKPKKYQEEKHDPDELRPFELIDQGLAVGNEMFAGDLQSVKSKHVTHIISIGSRVMNEHEDEGIKYLVIGREILDAPFQEILPTIKQVCEFIDQAMKENKDSLVFIHCVQGLSRSSALVFGYLIHKNHWDYETTRDFVNKRRSKACPNLGFELQLRRFIKYGYNFDAPELQTPWKELWLSEIKDIAPSLLEEAKEMEKQYSLNNGDNYATRLYQVYYHFMTIHIEDDKLDEQTKKFKEIFIDIHLNIAEKYIGADTAALNFIRSQFGRPHVTQDDEETALLDT